MRLGGYTLQALREREAPPRRRRLTEEDRRRRREEPFGRRNGEVGAKRGDVGGALVGFSLLLAILYVINRKIRASALENGYLEQDNQ